jgi:hypothetical protein
LILYILLYFQTEVSPKTWLVGNVETNDVLKTLTSGPMFLGFFLHHFAKDLLGQYFHTKLTRGHQMMSHITMWVFPEPFSQGKHLYLPDLVKNLTQNSSEIAWLGFQYFPDFFAQQYRKFRGLHFDVQVFLFRCQMPRGTKFCPTGHQYWDLCELPDRKTLNVKIQTSEFSTRSAKQIWKILKTYLSEIQINNV